MDSVAVFESESDLDSNTSLVQVIEGEEDVGANVILSTTTSPPQPRRTPMKLIKVLAANLQPLNQIKANQNKVVVKVAEPYKPVVVQNIIEDYVIETIKEENCSETDLISEEYGVTEPAQGGENELTELTTELCQPSMKEIVQYELLYPGGPIEQVKVEQVPEEHDYVPLPESVKEYFCGVCGKSYSSEKSVRQHMTRTHGVCVEKNTGRGKVKREQPLKRVVCELCGRKYASAAALRYHQRVHTGEKPFQCPECPKAFTMPLFLQIHLRTHTGERPYPCAICPKAFSNQAALLRHNRVHTGIKPYRCEECGKSFTQSNSKKLHIRTVHLKLPAPYMSKERRMRQLRRNDALAQKRAETAGDSDSQLEYLPNASYVIDNIHLNGTSFVVQYNKSDDN